MRIDYPEKKQKLYIFEFYFFESYQFLLESNAMSLLELKYSFFLKREILALLSSRYSYFNILMFLVPID